MNGDDTLPRGKKKQTFRQEEDEVPTEKRERSGAKAEVYRSRYVGTEIKKGSKGALVADFFADRFFGADGRLEFVPAPSLGTSCSLM